MNKLSLTLIFLASSNIAYASSQTIYQIEQTSSHTLNVSVDRSKHPAETELVFRGASMGIASQVKNVMCDGLAVEEIKSGVWQMPATCQKLQWQIPLRKGDKELAANQQSIKSGSFMLLSVVSSLPQLQDAETEIVNITLPNVKTIFPKTDATNSIVLPSRANAPFFILLNPVVVDSITSENISLNYFLDRPEFATELPAIHSHMNALKWLNTIIPGRKNENFSIAWLGIAKEKMALAGAAGEDVLLTNYPNNGGLKFGKTMLLYVTLHEAFHQFAMQYPDQPSWAAESLATYYGIRAIEIASPNDPDNIALLQRFKQDGNRFHDGLVTINRKIKNGDRSEYLAFYTKGLAFWIAVDEALQQTQGKRLDYYLLKILQTKYDADGEPINMQNILHLSSEKWLLIQQNFLN